MPHIPEQDWIEALWEALHEPGRWKRFNDATRERYAWQGSYRQATTRICQWFDPNDHHRLPAESLVDAVLVIGDARFLDSILALEFRLRKRRPAKVERVRERRSA